MESDMEKVPIFPGMHVYGGQERIAKTAADVEEAKSLVCRAAHHLFQGHAGAIYYLRRQAERMGDDDLLESVDALKEALDDLSNKQDRHFNALAGRPE